MKGMWQRCRHFAVVGVAIMSMQSVFAAEKIVVDIHKLNDNASTHGIGEKIGTITFEDSKAGLKIESDLKGLAAGDHGFHIHEHPSCDGGEKDHKWVAGLAAGSHFDPEHTGHHLGPKGKGHLGDLPVLVVNQKGETKTTVVAERLKLADITNRSIMIHEGGDNYSDVPPLGGGGARIACGVIKKG